jgi:hypothetical protein
MVAGQVGLVTRLHVGPELLLGGILTPALKLPAAPSDSDLGRGVEVDLAIRVGKHHGPGVPPHQQPPLSGRIPLKMEESLAHRGLAGRTCEQSGVPRLPELGS